MRTWQTIRVSSLGRHLHAEMYAAVVLAGGYEEAGDHGRFRVEAGDVLVHDRFEAHLDRFSIRGAMVLNLRMPEDYEFQPGLARILDTDCIVRAAEKNRREAAGMLLSMLLGRPTVLADWPDELAAAIIEDASLRLSRWSMAKGIAPWTISRGFTQVFGISPEAFRARTRARRAWKAIQHNGNAPLAGIAAELGFADQAHMSRSVREMTGMAPREWRAAANRFKTN
jgi:AraC-like DNA-binding protein